MAPIGLLEEFFPDEPPFLAMIEDESRWPVPFQ
jgi:hypothetical protein